MWRSLAIAILLGLTRAIAATAAEPSSSVIVLTSLPASVYEPVREAFEVRYPDVRLRIVNRKTTAGVAILLDRSREPADVFWASATDAFALLAAAQRFAPAPVRPFPVPQRIGNFPIDDPGGFYRGFALSGYGVVWNEDYLARHGLAAPQRIRDLTGPSYRGHLGMTAPSRSGTTHLMVEALLQQLGWETGWAVWMEIAGNLATVTARSYGVSTGVAQSRFGIGLSIDFLGRAAEPKSDAVRFAYPAENIFMPASVAILRDAPNQRGASLFVDFLLSEAGQRLLASPAIGRLPVDPSAYRPNDSSNPYRIIAKQESKIPSFDAALSGQRYELVNLLFDEAITYRLLTLQEVWQDVRALEARQDRTAPYNAGVLAQVRAALTVVPVTDAQARDAAYASDLRRLPWGVAPPARQASLVAAWREFFEARHAEAKRLVAELHNRDTK